MNFAGCSLTASFTPIHSYLLKTNCRLPFSIFHRNLTKSKSLSAYTQKDQLLVNAVMVAGRYPPPLFSVAPMMEWTDNHYRTLARLISKHAWLYTEMLAAETIVYQKDNLDRFLEYSPEQHPIVLQIGGNNLENLAKATKLANPYHYDEINFNCGCPSPKVAGHGCFGVRLMLDPKFVGEAMSVIAANTDAPVSVKCRIGVDNHDSYNELCDFIYKVSSLSPTRHFIIHSRKALLNGISPAENRSIPPLKYEYFYGLQRDFPDLRFTINGGITCVDEILEKYQVYGDSILGKYGPRPRVRDVVMPLINFFHSEPGNGLWKRKADAAFQHCTTIKSFLEETLVAIPDRVLDSSVAKPAAGRDDLFADIHSMLPPPYNVREQEVVLYA